LGPLLIAAALALGACSSAPQLPYHVERSRRALDSGSLFFARGQLELARSAFRDGLSYAEAADLEQEVGSALNNLGMVALAQDQTDEAVALFTRALALGDGSDAFCARVLLNLAAARLDAAEAQARIEQAAALAGDDAELVARVRTTRALWLARQGNVAAARTELDAVEAESRARKDTSSLAAALANLAALDLQDHQPASALTRLTEALTLDRAHDDPIAIGNDLSLLATTYRDLGRPQDAATAAQRAFAIHQQLPNPTRAAADRALLESVSTVPGTIIPDSPAQRR
jgi:tetratricopeptide (TPR) repeat protein